MALPSNAVPVFGFNPDGVNTGISFDADGNLKVSGGPGGVTPVGSAQTSASATATRPANTTAYAAHDVMTDATTPQLTFANLASASGGSGLLLSVNVLMSNLAAAGITLRLHLFSDTPSAGYKADNEPFVVSADDIAIYVGYVDIWMQAGGTGSAALGSVEAPHLGFRCETGSKDIYGQLEILSAHTPVSGSTIAVSVTALPNPA